MSLTAADLRLYLITDDIGRSAHELATVVGKAITGGATMVQFREKTASPAKNAESFRILTDLCNEREVPLLLNADLMGQFDGWEANNGIHYSARTLPLQPDAVRDPAGYSAHSVDEAVAASQHPITFCTLSCIFESPSKTEEYPPVGLRELERVRRNLPHGLLIALGGVDHKNAADCIRSGADGVAVIRAVFADPDPTSAARRLREQVESALLEQG